MLKRVDITIDFNDYRERLKQNKIKEKIALYDLEEKKIVYEGEYEDWITLELLKEELNIEYERYYLYIQPNIERKIKPDYIRGG